MIEGLKGWYGLRGWCVASKVGQLAESCTLTKEGKGYMRVDCTYFIKLQQESFGLFMFL